MCQQIRSRCLSIVHSRLTSSLTLAGFPRNASSSIRSMLCWNHRPLAHLSLLFVPTSLLLLSTFSLLPSIVPSQKSPPSMQGQTEPIPSNLSELFTKEPNWPIEDFDERKQPKKRKDNQLTSRYGLRIDHCPDGGEPELDSLNGQVKLCQLDDECRPSYRCQNIIGLTHFGKQMRYCCPTKTTACTEKPRLEPVIPGQCRPLRTFYYFDIEQLACVKARMAQCEDFGRNRFASKLECRTKCETTACELGESILLHNSSFDKPFLCQSDEDCPVGYNCRQDHIFRRSVCCGFLDFEPCPLGFRSFTVPFSGRPKTCVSSDTRDECPTDYVCTQNQLNQEHYCCTVENGVCPEGHQAYIHPLTDGTIKCNLKGYESTTSCPPGYACLAAVFGSSWGFCCSQAVVASCPEDSYPQINALTNQPQRCEMMQLHACAKGFICESDSVSHLGFCCSVPRRSSKKKTHPPELIPRKKAIRPIHLTTVEPEEEEVAVEETTAPTKMPPTTTERAPPEATFVATTTSRGKRKGEWKGKGGKKSKKKGGNKKGNRNAEEAVADRDSEEGSSSSPSSSSDEKSEDHEEVAELSTKLDRYITGMRRRTALPRGHRPKPRIWKLKKGRGLGQELIPVPTRRGGKEDELEEIDEVEALPEDEESRWKRKLKRRHPRPRCPSNYRPMEYPGTRWNYLECLLEGQSKKKHRKKEWEQQEEEEDDDADDAETFSSHERKRHRSQQCPKPAVCLKAKNDPFHRALCCLKKRTESVQEEEEEQGENEAEENEDVEERADEFEKEEAKGKVKKKGKMKKKVKETGEDEEQQQEEEDGINEEENVENEQENENEEAAERQRMAEELAAIREREAEMEAALNKGNKRPSESAVSIAIPVSTLPPSTTTTATASTTRSRSVSVLMVEKSNDPACPRLIADRVCVPGSTKDCREPGFFCQFNKEKHQFVCCAKK